MKGDQGLLRVTKLTLTKLLDSEDEFSVKYPILLPSKRHVENSLIRDLKNCHDGLQTVGSLLSEKYWSFQSSEIFEAKYLSASSAKDLP